MLNRLELTNFKFHKYLDLKMAPITVMTGMNGMGKSSVIQSLMLLRQSALSGDLRSGVRLNGNLCELGTIKDVFCANAEGEYLGIKVSFVSGESADYRLILGDESDNFMSLAPSTVIGSVDNESLYTDNFQYISAFRYGPQKLYKSDTKTVKQHRQLSDQMGQCEYAVDYLYQYGKEKVCPALFYDETEDTQLEDQVAHWMSAITSKISINIKPEGTNTLSLNYGYQGRTSKINVSAINTGFGISYVLPIVIAILSAQPGSLIVIENPEAHIHPKAQSVLMRLIAKAAKAGIQFVIESHSDHVINGLMVAVVNKIIEPEDVSLSFFRVDRTSQMSELCPLEVTPEGRIKKAPKDFFDQIDIDLQIIMGF